MEDTSPDPLPRDPGTRLLIAVLALPSFLVFLTCLIAIPASSPPPSTVFELLVLLLMTEVIGLAVLFTFLALVWAAWTPEWVARLLKNRARRLIVVTGVFLLIGGGMILVAAVRARLPVPALIMAMGVVLGAFLLWRAPIKSD